MHPLIFSNYIVSSQSSAKNNEQIVKIAQGYKNAAGRLLCLTPDYAKNTKNVENTIDKIKF